jgi:hypothetical protein
MEEEEEQFSTDSNEETHKAEDKLDDEIRADINY